MNKFSVNGTCEAKDDWEVNINTSPKYEFIDSIRNVGGDCNFDPKYMRALGWIERAGRATPPEWNYFVVQLTISGSGSLIHHGVRYRLPAGVGFVAQSTDCDVSYHNPCENDQPWNFVYLEIYGNGMQQFCQEVTKTQGPCFNFSVDDKLVHKISSFRYFNEKSGAVSLGEQQLICGELRKMVIDGGAGLRQVHSRIVEQALELIEQGQGVGMTVNELAKKLSVSREYLSREFQKALNTTPYKYILQRKFTAAITLLNHTNLSIKEVAFKLGFSSSTVFGRQFKASFGITPASVRGRK